MATDEALFHLILSALPQYISITRFQSKNFQLSGHYQFKIEFYNNQYHHGQTFIKQNANLVWESAKNKHYVHGIITQCDYLGPTPQGYYYRITLASPLAVLKLRVQTRVFVDKTVQEIFTEVLETAGFNKASYHFALDHAHPKLPFTVQYNEIDLHFLERLASQYGLFYYFEQSECDARIHFLDNSIYLPGVTELSFHPLSDHSRPMPSIYKIEPSLKLCSNRIDIHASHDALPNSPLHAFAVNHTNIPGMHTEQYDDIYSQEKAQLEWQAKVRLQAIDSQRLVWLAESDDLSLSVGQLLQLKVHPEDTYNRLYRIIAIDHRAQENHRYSHHSPQAFRYYNRLKLIPADTPFRAAMNRTKPKFHGLWCGTITSHNDNPYGAIDKEGYYRVRFAFDQRNIGSMPLRLMQSYGDGHPERGLHFPLHAGTLVAIACINGELDRPVILGALPTPEQSNPVTSHNATQAILRSHAGNEIRFDDNPDQLTLAIQTPDEKNYLTLSAEPSEQQIAFISQEGDIAIQIKKAIQIQCQGQHHLFAKETHTVQLEGYQHILADQLQINANEIEIYAQHSIWQSVYLSYQARYVDWQVQKRVSLQAFDTLRMDHTQRMAWHGDFSMTAPRVCLRSGRSQIDIDAQGRLSFKAKHIAIHSPLIIEKY